MLRRLAARTGCCFCVAFCSKVLLSLKARPERNARNALLSFQIVDADRL